MVGGSLVLSVAVLVVAFAVLAYSVFSFAHVRISDVDMTELDRLRREGVLPDKPRLVEDFELIHAKIAHVAPAVYLRQEFWLRLYFHLLRAARTIRPNAVGLDRELLRLSAYQAHHYWVAMKRLDALRNPSL
jgi:hypothetical protein